MATKRRKHDPTHHTGATPAIVALDRASIDYTLREYDHEAIRGFGAEAAHLLGQDEARVFKTLIAEVDKKRLVVGVVPVSGQLNLKALAAAAGGKKAAMADLAAAERSSGYVHGGISPLGQRSRLATVIDTSAHAFPTIYVSAGKRGLQAELAAADLAKVARATFADIAAPGSHPRRTAVRPEFCESAARIALAKRDLRKRSGAQNQRPID